MSLNKDWLDLSDKNKRMDLLKEKQKRCDDNGVNAFCFTLMRCHFNKRIIRSQLYYSWNEFYFYRNKKIIVMSKTSHLVWSSELVWANLEWFSSLGDGTEGHFHDGDIWLHFFGSLIKHSSILSRFKNTKAVIRRKIC